MELEDILAVLSNEQKTKYFHNIKDKERLVKAGEECIKEELRNFYVTNRGGYRKYYPEPPKILEKITKLSFQYRIKSERVQELANDVCIEKIRKLSPRATDSDSIESEIEQIYDISSNFNIELNENKLLLDLYSHLDNMADECIKGYSYAHLSLSLVQVNQLISEKFLASKQKKVNATFFYHSIYSRAKSFIDDPEKGMAAHIEDDPEIIKQAANKALDLLVEHANLSFENSFCFKFERKRGLYNAAYQVGRLYSLDDNKNFLLLRDVFEKI